MIVSILRQIFRPVKVSVRLGEDLGAQDPLPPPQPTWPTIRVSTGAFTEGTDTHAVFIITLTENAINDVALSLALSGTADSNDYGTLEVSTDGVAYSAGSNITIATGNNVAYARVPITDDVLSEVDETIVLTASRTSGTTANASAVGVVTLADNDGDPEITVTAGDDVIEGAAYAYWTVALDAPAPGTVTANLALSGTASAQDYGFIEVSTDQTNWSLATTAEVTDAPLHVRVSIVDDALVEANETIILTATVASGPATGSASDTVTVIDYDSNTPVINTLAIAGDSISDMMYGDGLRPGNNQETIDYFESRGYAPTIDSHAVSGADFRVSGSDRRSIALQIQDIITQYSGQSNVAVLLMIGTNEYGFTGTDWANWTEQEKTDFQNEYISLVTDIIDAGFTPLLCTIPYRRSAGDEERVEQQNQQLVWPVIQQYCPLVWDSTNGVPRLDMYQFTFDFGATWYSDTVHPDDTVGTPATREWLVDILENVITMPAATPNPQLTVSPAQATVTEGTDTHAVWDITLSTAPAETITVDLALSGDATAVSDYGTLEVSTDGSNWSAATSVSFLGGDQTVHARVAIVDDGDIENNETITLTATTSAGSTNNPSANASITLVSEDAPAAPTPTLSVAADQSPVTEGTDTYAVWSLTLDEEPLDTVTCSLAVTGSATSGTDYGAVQVSTDGTNWSAATSVSFTGTDQLVQARVQILDDEEEEAAESLTLTATVTAGTTTNSDASAAITLISDEVAGTDGVAFNGVDEYMTFPAWSGISYATEAVYTTETDDGFLVSMTEPVTEIGRVGANYHNSTVTSDTIVLRDNCPAQGGDIVPLNSTDGAYVSIPAATFSGAFDVSLWFYWDGVTSQDVLLGNIANNDNTLWFNGDNLIMRVGSNTNLFSTNVSAFRQTGAWNEIRVTRDVSDNIAVEINGQDTGIAVSSGNTWTLDVIGGNFFGLVWEGAIVGVDMQGEDTADRYYAMKDDTGNTVIDSGTGAQHGTWNDGTENGGTRATVDGATVDARRVAYPVVDRTFDMTSAGVVAYTGDAAGNATLVNMDASNWAGATPTPTLSVSASQSLVTEGINDYAVWLLSLDDLPVDTTTLSLALSGTASAADHGDIEVSDDGVIWSTASEVTYPSSEQVVQARVQILDDAVDEGSETIILTATVTAGTVLNSSDSATITLADNDGASGNTLTLNGTDEYFTFDGWTPEGDADVQLTTDNDDGFVVDTGTFPITEVGRVGSDYHSGTIEALAINDTSPLAQGSMIAFQSAVDATAALQPDSAISIPAGTDFTLTFWMINSFPSGTTYLFGGGSTGATRLRVTDDGGNIDLRLDRVATGNDGDVATTYPFNDGSLMKIEFAQAGNSQTLKINDVSQATWSRTADTLIERFGNTSGGNNAVGDKFGEITLDISGGNSYYWSCVDGTGEVEVDHNGSGNDLTWLQSNSAMSAATADGFRADYANNIAFNFSTAGQITDDNGVATNIALVGIDSSNWVGGSSPDPTLAVVADQGTVTEGIDTYAAWTLSLGSAPAADVTLSLAISGTVDGNDYSNLEVSTDGTNWSSASSVTFTAPDQTVHARVTVTDDATMESNELVTLTATVSAGATANASASASVIVVSDESTSYPNIQATQPASGYTTFSPDATNTQIIYVSSSEGDNANDGLSEANPKQTLAAGLSALRDGFPDWLCLKCGDVWDGNSLSLPSGLNGQDAANPIVITSYGTGARPMIRPASNSNGINSIGATVSQYFAFVGLHVRSHYRDPDDPAFNNAMQTGGGGFRWYRGGGDVHVEDCVFEWFSENLNIDNVDEVAPLENFVVRKNIIRRAYSGSNDADHAQGIFFSTAHGMVFEDNIVDHNGHDETGLYGPPTIFNHNIYFQGSATGITVRRNIISRGSSHGMQCRTGGQIIDNILIRNSINILCGVNGVTGEDGSSLVSGNYLWQGKDIDGSTLRGWGIDLGAGSLATVENNISANIVSTNSSRRNINDPQGTGTIQNNIEHNWSPGTDTGATYVDPGRTPESYVDFLESTTGSTYDDFINTAMDAMYRGSTESDYTYAGLRAYLGAGFVEA